jgi:general L-amino acid transport system permease protein
MVAISMTWFAGTMLHVAACLITNQGLGRWIIRLTGFADKDDRSHKYPLIAVAAAAFLVVSFVLSGWQVKEVGSNLWGGLFLTLVISGIGIASALPAGIVLALGRRSHMPVIRVMCVTFIELFRSVPLITILFMATTMFPLFLPEGLVFNKLASAIVAVCLFSSAYMAETVRGGLQAIERGQYEAAEAMGLGYWQSMGLIIMPQALKLMIPNIVGSFIGLFKDTTLVSIIGLYDLLGMISAVSQDPQWIGLHHEPLFTAAMIYFVGCFAMSKYSQHLERTLGAGDRR